MKHYRGGIALTMFGLGVLIALGNNAVDLSAQSVRIAPAASPLFKSQRGPGDPSPNERLAGAGRTDYAIEGLLVGAAIGGTAVTLVGLQHCESDCGVGTAALGFLLGAVLGAIPGLLIGGLIEK